MKKAFLIITLVAVLSSCNGSRVAELEAENVALKDTIEQLTFKTEAAQRIAEQAQMAAEVAQRRAEEEALRAQEATENARRNVK